MGTKKSSPALFRVFLAGAILALLTACSQNRESAGRSEAITKGGDMQTIAQLNRAQAPIPPIDAAAPAEFETATFGLG